MTTKASRVSPNTASLSLVGSQRELETLDSIHWAGFLTTKQLAALHFPSRRVAQRRLRALLDHQWVRAHLQLDSLPLPNVYTLTRKGAEVLAEATETAEALEHIARARLPRRSKLAHAIAIRDVFVAFRLLESRDGIDLFNFHFEPSDSDYGVLHAARLVPDAVVQVGCPAGIATLAIEVDLGTEGGAALRDKLDKWFAFLRSEVSRAAFGSAAATRLLVVTKGERRRDFIEQLVRNANLINSSVVTTFETLEPSLQRLYSRETYATPRRAARITPRLQPAETTNISARANRASRPSPTFRPIRSGEHQ